MKEVSMALFVKLHLHILLLVLAVGLTMGCAGIQLVDKPSEVENLNLPGDEAYGYSNLTSDQVITFIQKCKPLILDVRTQREYEQSHLESAVLIPLGELATRMDDLSENFSDCDIVIYCKWGNRSETASKLLVENGFSRIINMHGGLKAWMANDYPVVVSNRIAE